MTITARKMVGRLFDQYADKAHIANVTCQSEANHCVDWFWNHLTLEEQKLLTSSRLAALKDKGQQKGFVRACRTVRKALVVRGVLK